MRVLAGVAIVVAGLFWIGMYVLVLAWGEWQETSTPARATPLFAGMFALGALAVVAGVYVAAAHMPSRAVRIGMCVVLVAGLGTLVLPRGDRAAPVNRAFAAAYTERTGASADPSCRWSDDETASIESWLCGVEHDAGSDLCVATVSKSRRDSLVSLECCSWRPGESLGGVVICA